jgi:uncharacterized membrane protein (DUF4010 family)
MEELSAPLETALGFLLAAAIGFLVGRTREEEGTRRAGIRDFIIVALTGGIAAYVNLLGVTIVLIAAVTLVLLAMRFNHPERAGITTELAALATFLLGYLALSSEEAVAAGLGIALTIVLVTKEQIHEFALRTVSEREFGDTLKFLVMIFVILPLLPEGSYGPFGFFEPRKIWFFIILVSAVSFVGYFLAKFLGPEKGMLLGGLLGGLTSTTAYTGAASRAVAEAPDSAVPMARATLLANTIMFPRMLVISAVISPPLALAGLPALAAATLAGLASAWILGRAGDGASKHDFESGFKNPFALGPALKFGVIFTIVLFLVRAGRAWLGESGQLITGALGGLLDVDAVTLSMAQFFGGGEGMAREAILTMLLAATTNAVFKSVLAQSSGQAAFYLRMIAGFVIMLAAGLAVLFLVPMELLTGIQMTR